MLFLHIQFPLPYEIDVIALHKAMHMLPPFFLWAKKGYRSNINKDFCAIVDNNHND